MKIGASFSVAAEAASENTVHHPDREKNVSRPAQSLCSVDNSSKNKLRSKAASAVMGCLFPI